MVCAARGIKCAFVMPETMSRERKLLLKAYGAELILTPGPEGMGGAITKAEELAEPTRILHPAAVREPGQPGHPPRHHRRGNLGRYRRPGGHRRAGVGTGGTVTGVGEALKAKKPGVKVVAVEPAACAGAVGWRERPAPDPGHRRRLRAGHAQHRRCTTRSSGRPTTTPSPPPARLAKEEGLLVGISSGAAVLGRPAGGRAPGERRQADRGHHPVLRRALPVDGALPAPRRVSPFDTAHRPARLRLLQVGASTPVATSCRCGSPTWISRRPPAVLDALHRRIEHGVFGYGGPWPSLTESVLAHLQDEYGWSIEPEWLVWLPGLVTGLNVACRAVDGEVLTGNADTTRPSSAPRTFPAESCIVVDLALDENRWHWDMAAHAAGDDGRHRAVPVLPPAQPGRPLLVAQRTARPLADYAERQRSGRLLRRDPLRPDPRRRQAPHPARRLSPEWPSARITLLAPSKTFNIPGLGCAFAVIPNPALRRRFERAMHGIVPHVNVLGLAACEAAFRARRRLAPGTASPLRGNRNRVAATMASLPGVRTSAGEATYLAWIDVPGSAASPTPAAHFEAHGIGLSDGKQLRRPGWLRLNFGCPRATLDEALSRFERAVRAA